MVIAQIHFIRNFTIMQNLKHGMHRVCSFKNRNVHYTNIFTDLESVFKKFKSTGITLYIYIYMDMIKHPQITCT